MEKCRVLYENKCRTGVRNLSIVLFQAGIPAVCILFGGSCKEIEVIFETVVDNRIPVIVLEDSGGAADVIACAYTNMSKHG